ncbi:BTAD domain-containing putative transcriptional regulator [Nonomuraea rubra]|uniref:BTAD domain-containing putative transcriptional regulator n=1 Tax=Nonomuraea rubra TaxID=46180 RepID=UPI0033C96E31
MADDDDVDAFRFSRLAAEGRAALGEGDARRAVALLRAALGLWRGPALAEPPESETARAAAVRLEELRLAALEDRIEAELRLPDHHPPPPEPAPELREPAPEPHDAAPEPVPGPRKLVPGRGSWCPEERYVKRLGVYCAAFARYEEEMREYAAGCVKMGDGVAGFMVPGSRFMAGFLNRYYKIMPYLPGKNLMTTLARKTAENISLRDYGELVKR